MPNTKIPRPISPLFSSYITAQEKKSLRAASVTDCSSEINLLRILNAQFFKLQNSSPMDMESYMKALRSQTILSEQFMKIIRVHNREHNPLAELQKSIQEAIDQAIEELGLTEK